MSHQDDHHRKTRARLTAAAVTGLFAGVARAVADWLLRHLADGW